MSDEATSTASALIESIDRRTSSVRTQQIDFSFNELADMYASEEMVIQPEFQRLFRWTEGAQSRFIESLLLELPIPPIFLIEQENRVYELIDGLQRVSSYLHFRGLLENPAGELELSECDIATELNGLKQGGLPRALDIKLKRSYVRAEILRKESDPQLRYYMFKRLNTGGERLSEQEVRNATIRLLSNDFNALIIELSDDERFSKSIDIISDQQRQKRFDHELVLRFFAFKNDSERYRHDIADFLTEYMEEVSDPKKETTFDFAAEKAVFLKTFLILARFDQILKLESRIFGSVTSGSVTVRGQFSVYHFEGLSLGLQSVLDRIDPQNTEQMESLAQVALQGKTDPAFLVHTGSGKNDRVPYLARVKYFTDLFGTALDG
jgi:hypothetical protein